MVSYIANKTTGTKCTWHFETFWSWTRSQEPQGVKDAILEVGNNMVIMLGSMVY